MHFRHLMSVHFQTLYFFHRFRTLQVINVSATFTKKMGMNGSICIKISIFLINCKHLSRSLLRKQFQGTVVFESVGIEGDNAV